MLLPLHFSEAGEAALIIPTPVGNYSRFDRFWAVNTYLTSNPLQKDENITTVIPLGREDIFRTVGDPTPIRMSSLPATTSFIVGCSRSWFGGHFRP